MGDYIKTIGLLSVLSIILVLVGGAVGGEQGLWIAFIFSLIMNGVAYFFSDKIALKSSGAKPLSKEQAPEIYAMVKELSKKMNMPMPALYRIPTNQANAFATGRNPKNASVAVTDGLVSRLNKEELKGVLAHELAHVKNRDILIASVAAVLASTITFVARMGMYGGFGSNRDNRGSGGLGILLALLAPLAGILIQMAISREREYEADETGASSVGGGNSLASALIKIHESTRSNPMDVNPAFSSLYISNPLGKLGGLSTLFSTHPPVEKRVSRLKNILDYS